MGGTDRINFNVYMEVGPTRDRGKKQNKRGIVNRRWNEILLNEKEKKFFFI